MNTVITFGSNCSPKSNLLQKRTERWDVKRVSQNSKAKPLTCCEGILPLFWRCFVDVQSIERTTRNRKNKTLHKKHNCVVCTEVNHNIIKTIHRQGFSSANQNISENKSQCVFEAVLRDFPNQFCLQLWVVFKSLTVYSGMRFPPYRLLNVSRGSGVAGWGLLTLSLYHFFLFLTNFRKSLL